MLALETLCSTGTDSHRLRKNFMNYYEVHQGQSSNSVGWLEVGFERGNDCGENISCLDRPLVPRVLTINLGAFSKVLSGRNL